MFSFDKNILINNMIQNKNQKYQTFLNWFTQNGGLYQDITFPTSFPPTNYIGISASKTIIKNKIIMAIPKKLIIGVDLVLKSQLRQIIEQYDIFQGQDNDDKDFNILTLFIIYEQMKGKSSFYRPYLDCVDLAQTLFYWSDKEINQVKDPFLNIPFISEIRVQFEPTFEIFKEIISKHHQLFSYPLERDLFDFCYGIVMTRCFGWGLPQTMIVPFADFLNHQSNGVHHYAFCKSLETQKNPEYIKKSRELDLNIFGINNQSSLPKYYLKNDREKFLQENAKLIKEKQSKQQNKIMLKKPLQSSSMNKIQEYLNVIRRQKVTNGFQDDLYLSSDSEDNDSNSEDSLEEDIQKWGEIGVQYIKQKKFLRKLFGVVRQNQEEPFVEPKPMINKQFQDGVTFNWWNVKEDSYFIVASDRNYQAGEQIFNSYGRRNNRFLLLWYGFTFENNKYDSVPLRLWDERIASTTGKMVFTRFITERDIKNKIPIGNERYSYTYLSSQFRLKKRQIHYELLAFLRYKMIKTKPKYKLLQQQLKYIYMIVNLQLEIQVCQFYGLIIKELIDKYQIEQDRCYEIMTKEERKCYASVLINSNADIIMAHLKGITYILFFLQKIKENAIKTKQQLIIFYKSEWDYIEKTQDNKYQNRIFIHHYFKLLNNFLINQ